MNWLHDTLTAYLQAMCCNSKCVPKVMPRVLWLFRFENQLDRLQHNIASVARSQHRQEDGQGGGVDTGMLLRSQSTRLAMRNAKTFLEDVETFVENVPPWSCTRYLPSIFSLLLTCAASPLGPKVKNLLGKVAKVHPSSLFYHLREFITHLEDYFEDWYRRQDQQQPSTPFRNSSDLSFSFSERSNGGIGGSTQWPQQPSSSLGRPSSKLSGSATEPTSKVEGLGSSQTAAASPNLGGMADSLSSLLPNSSPNFSLPDTQDPKTSSSRPSSSSPSALTPHIQRSNAHRIARSIMEEVRVKYTSLITELEWMISELIRTFRPCREEILHSGLRSIFMDFFDQPNPVLDSVALNKLTNRFKRIENEYFLRPSSSSLSTPSSSSSSSPPSSPPSSSSLPSSPASPPSSSSTSSSTSSSSSRSSRRSLLPTHEEYKQDFLNLLTSFNGGCVPTTLLLNLEKWIRRLETVLRLTERDSLFSSPLLTFRSSTSIEIPGQYPTSQAPQRYKTQSPARETNSDTHVLISHFHERTWSLRWGDTQRRTSSSPFVSHCGVAAKGIYFCGNDGRTYPFAIHFKLRNPSPSDNITTAGEQGNINLSSSTHKDNASMTRPPPLVPTVAQSKGYLNRFLEALNNLILSHREPRQRGIQFNIETVIPLSSMAHLCAREPDYLSLEEMYSSSSSFSPSQTGQQQQQSSSFSTEEMEMLNKIDSAVGQDQPRSLRQLLLKSHALSCGNPSSSSFASRMNLLCGDGNHLRRYFENRAASYQWYFEARKVFLKQLSMVNVLAYMRQQQHLQVPENLLFSERTFRMSMLYSWSALPISMLQPVPAGPPLQQQQYLLYPMDPMPFRLTRNILRFVTPEAVEAEMKPLLCSIGLAVSSIQAQKQLKNELNLYLSEDLISTIYLQYLRDSSSCSTSSSSSSSSSSSPVPSSNVAPLSSPSLSTSPFPSQSSSSSSSPTSSNSSPPSSPPSSSSDHPDQEVWYDELAANSVPYKKNVEAVTAKINGRISGLCPVDSSHIYQVRDMKAGPVTIHHHVEKLIQAAQNPNLISVMSPDWHPWF